MGLVDETGDAIDSFDIQREKYDTIMQLADHDNNKETLETEFIIVDDEKE